MKSRARIFIGAAALVTAGLVLWIVMKPAAAKAAVNGGSATTAKKEAASLHVSGIKMKPSPFSEVLVANGSLRAEESVELQAETNGKITALNFVEGMPVKSGDLLVKIDDASLLASLRRADARREHAHFREKRLAKLVEDGGVSQQDYDEARAELSVQEAEADLIRAEIKKTEIRAPFDGVVGLRFVSLGAYVNPNARIATLQRVNNLKVDFSVPERYATYLKPGASIRFTVAGSTVVYSGEVYAIEPRIDINTRTVFLRALCSNPDLALVPGIFARIELTVNKASDAFLVPAISILSGLEERYVFIAKDGKANRVQVRTGARTATHVQIVDGIKPGDVVLTSGIQQMRPGLAIKVDFAP